MITPREPVGWSSLEQFVAALEEGGHVLRIQRPVDVELEAGCIADRVVKMGGKAIIFEQPRLPNGNISKMPLIMNLFGSHERTKMALGVNEFSEIGNRLVGMMKPDIATISKKPWKGISLALQGLRMSPKRVKRAPCQEIMMKNPDLTRIPIPKTWPDDGGQFITLPLVITKNPESGEHNIGMYRSQIYGPKECGLHWQTHKHGAEHADSNQVNEKVPVAICLGGPPELIFSAIAPLPDNLSEFMFASFLRNKRLPLVKAKTQNLWVPAECDVVIEGYYVPGETRTEGPFGDHFGLYSLEGDYPVMHVTAITHKTNPLIPMTIVGLPPMEDGFLGESIGDSFLPVLNFQHRDVVDLFIPLQTGFHNLAIIASKQRYPRQARKTCLGLLGAGQLMFTKISVAVDADHKVKDFNALLDALHQKVEPASDLITIQGMVSDTLDSSSPWENVHDKLLIDATTIPHNDPRKGGAGIPRGSSFDATPDWRRGLIDAPGVSVDFCAKVRAMESVSDAILLRPSIMVITTKITHGPDSKIGMKAIEDPNSWVAQVDSSREQRKKIKQLMDLIWQLEDSENLRWLFITDDDVKLHSAGANQKLLWQLTVRFDVARDLYFDSQRKRICWDATTPIPHPGIQAIKDAGQPTTDFDSLIPIRSWPPLTLHDTATLTKVTNYASLDGYEENKWESNGSGW